MAEGVSTAPPKDGQERYKGTACHDSEVINISNNIELFYLIHAK